MSEEIDTNMKSNDAGKSRSWLLSGGIVVVVLLWLASGQFSDSDNDNTVASNAASQANIANTSVRVRNQSAELVQRTISVNGKTAPARMVVLAAETDGRIEAVVAARGANVERGGIIVRLDERDRSARLLEAQATVKLRQVEFDGRDRLKSESYVSEAQLQEAVARLEAAKAELARAKLDLTYRYIRAPFGGALQTRDVEVGDFVKVGDPVALFVDNRTIVVAANLSEFDARYVNVGDTAEATLATGEAVKGKIRYVAPVADEATRTFGVELEVDNTDGKLRVGGTAVLQIPAEEIMAHRVAPSLLTLDDAGNIGVKIVATDAVVRFVAADIALSSDNGVWLAGLPESITLITVGQGYVEDGAVVETVFEDDPNTSLAIQSDKKGEQ